MAVSRHLWIGGLPEKLTEEEIRDHFSRFGKIEGVKILPQRFPNTSLAAFIDFHNEKSAKEAQEAVIEIKGYEIRTNYKACARTPKGADSRPDKDPSSSRRHHSPVKNAEVEKSTQHDESSSSSDSDSSSNDSSSSSSSDSSEGARKNKHSLMLKMTHLPNRSDRVVHDALYHEFYNYSRHPEIRLYTDGDKRFAYIKLKTASEKKRAMKEVNGMSMFGVRLKLAVCSKEDFPRGGRDHPFPPPPPPPSQHSFMASHPPPRLGPAGATPRPFPSTDDIDPNATRSLFVGNIPKNISIYELRDVFMRFGPVLDVEIKKLGGSATYGFVLFYNLLDAIQAKKCMDGDTLGGNKIRVGFGKGTPSRLLWVDGVDPMLSESQIEKHFSQYGKINRVGIERSSYTALVQFDSVDDAKEAMEAAKGGFIGNSRSKIMIDYANKDAKVAFFQRLDSFPPPGPRMGAGMYNMHMGPPHNMMMIPGPVPPMMGMGIPPPHRPPMDYYYNPYMRDANFYGHYPGSHYPPPGPGMMRQYPPMYEGRNFDDYEDELRAFSRKRDRDRRREKEEERKPRRHSNSSESDDSDSGSEKKRHKSRSQKTKRHKSTSSKSDEDELEDDKSARKEKKKKRDKEIEGYSEDDAYTTRQRATQRSKEHRKKTQQKKDKSKEKENSAKETDVKKEQKKNVNTTETEEKSKITKPSEPVKKTGKDGVDKKLVITEPPAPPPAAPPSPPPPPPPPPLPASPVQSSVTTSKTKQSNSSPQLRSSSPDSSSQAVHGVIQPFQVKSRSSHDPAPSRQSMNDTRKRIESDLSDDDFTEEISKEEVPVKKKTELAPEQPAKPKGEFRKREALPSQSSETSSEGDKTRKPSAPSDDESTEKSKKLPRRYQIDEQGPRAGRRESREYSRRWSPSPPRRRQTLHSPPRDRLSRWKHSPPRQFSRSPPLRRSRSPPPRRSPLYHRSRSPPIYRRSRSPVYRRSRSPPVRRRSRSPVHLRSRSPPVHRRSRSPLHHRSPSPLRRQRSNSPPYGRSRTPIQRPARYRHESPPHDARKKRYHHSPSPPRHIWHKSPSPPSYRRRSRSPIRRPYTAKERSPSPRARPRHTSPPHRKSVASRSPSPSRARTGKELTNSKRRITVDKEEPKPEPPRSRTPPSEMPTKQKNFANDAKPATRTVSVSSAPPPSNKVTDTPAPLPPQADPPPPPPAPATPPAQQQQQQSSGLIDLLRRYPVMWQGHLVLKNDLAAVQLHFLSGNMNLAKISLPQASENLTPSLRIAQRMRLEQSQLEGVDKRIQKEQEHCLLLALPCGRDSTDVVAQTQALKNSLILYLIQKQAAGIINVQSPQGTHVLHIFPPCPFTQGHLSRVAPDLLSSASENCHLMIVVATV